MGNTSSAGNSETEEEDPPKEATSFPLEKDLTEYDGNIELTALFDPKQLRHIADKIKEDGSGSGAVSLLRQHQPSLVRWLDERRSRGAESITLGQFVDSFTNKGVSKQTATEIFQQFDIEGDGVVDLDYLNEMMELVSRSISSFAGIHCDIQAVNKLLQDCTLAPGFIDGFTNAKTVLSIHGQKLFKFLFRNRAHAASLPLPALKSFVTTTDMRLKVLRAHLRVIKEKDDHSKREPSLQADEILKPITRCFTGAEVSSNRNDASKLVDNDNGTYWQSDGPARSHWVRLKIPTNVVIKQLSMYVVSADQSYMPHHVVVYGGRDESNLQELSEVNIPNHITGDFTLLENVKVPYQLIQISIKRCHSDGCDTRIRQIKAVGYRVVKSKGVSVMDATAMWYLSVLAATAQAALPVAPELRESIILHTQTSLSHMRPLSLSSSSLEKPGFLSTNVMEQMETFLHSIICMNGSPPTQDVIVLLEFAAARGSLGSILDALKLLLNQVKLEYPAVPLLQSLAETEEKAVRRHGQKLNAVILSCDGGCRDAATTPSLVLSDNWKTETYFTANGKTKCNMAFGLKSGNLIQLTRVVMKLSKGAIGPRGGMVFVFDSDNIKDESGGTLFEPLEEYDDWTLERYEKFKEKARGEKEWKATNPVAYFNVDKEWCDVDIPVDRIQSGSCVTIKFLGPRQDSAERLGIIGINLYGYEQNEDVVVQEKNMELQTWLLPEDEEALVPGETVLLQSLKFLQVMSRDALNMKSNNTKEVSGQERDTTIDINDVTMEQIWSVHKLVSTSELSEHLCTLASEMVLSLFHIALPCLRPSVQKSRENKRINPKVKKATQEMAEKEMLAFSNEVFHALCDIVDKENTNMGVHKSAKAIILDGAELFFPDASTRRAHLLSLVDKVMEDGKAVSLAYTFESLCRFFSNKDASGLLGLPDSLPQESFQPESVVSVMKTLVSVAYRESLSQVECDAGSEIPSNLVLLLCAMQKSLLAWCHTQCSIEDARDTAHHILLRYIEMISQQCDYILALLENSTDKIKVLDRLEYSFVSMAMRQLVLFLNLFSSMDVDFISIIRQLQSLSYTIAKQTALLPPLFSGMATDSSKSSGEDGENSVLREWEVESEHDYENNSHVTKVFNCTGCSSFRVDFDARCQTERRFDYLEFTDSSGCKRRFDVSVGTDIWPTSVEFKSGQRLHFLFHSDASNTAWGYKFKVSAIGSPDVAVNWLSDLQLNIARCFGIFCGNALNSQTALAVKPDDRDENEEERALLHSELWASLFRGGYMVGKLERSLSGFHNSSPFDSNVNSFLCDLSSCTSDRVKAILEKCAALFTGQKLGGGTLLDSAVHAVFAALLWHTQELREQVSKILEPTTIGSDVIPSGVMLAYRTAEGVRRTLLERRQKLFVQLDEEENANTAETCNPDLPIISCREKALFLLKFAGLSKQKPRKISVHSSFERRSSVIGRPKGAHDNAECTKKVSSVHVVDEPSSYPSFQMIIDFVTNESLSHVKIQDLLHHRCRYAQTITKIYSFAYEYMKQVVTSGVEAKELSQGSVSSLSNPSNVTVVLFLQNMLSSQDSFPQHYADYLNGCGLKVEKDVRKSFYGFVRKLVEIVQENMNASLPCSGVSSGNVYEMSPLLKCLLSYLLHFLDIEWKAYDYNFVAELNIPNILVSAMQGMTIPISDNGEAEIQMLDKHKQFFKEAKDQGIDTWCERNRGSAPLDIQRDINLFIARYSSDLEVVITCDGCSQQIRGGRYRCLQCIDMDLCSACYMNGAKPNDHTSSHRIIHLRWTCDSCNAFIIETRIHCNSCNDFDLCLSCHRNETYPTYHTSAHSVTKTKLIPEGLTPVKCSEDTALKTYVQQHSWLQFCALMMTLTDSLQNNTKSGIEAEYMRSAGKLLLDCLHRLVACLAPYYSVPESSIECDGTKSATSLTKVKFHSEEEVMVVMSLDDDAGPVLPLLVDSPNMFQGKDDPAADKESEGMVIMSGNTEKSAHSSSDTLNLPQQCVVDASGVNQEDSYFSMSTEVEKHLVALPDLEGDEVDSKPMPTDGNVSSTASGTSSSSASSKSTAEGTEDTSTEDTEDISTAGSGHSSATSAESTSSQSTDESASGEKTNSGTSSSESSNTTSNSVTEVSKVSDEIVDGKASKEGNSDGIPGIKTDSATCPVASDTIAGDTTTTAQPAETSSSITNSSMTTTGISTTGELSSTDNTTGSGIAVSASETVSSGNTDSDDKNEKEGKEVSEEEDEVDSDLFFQEKILGLIGAIIPNSSGGSNNSINASFLTSDFRSFFSKKLLPVLFKIIKDSEANIKVRMIALGIMVKTLHCFGPEVGDVAVHYMIGEKVEASDSSGRVPGSSTVKFLFSLGTECLRSANLDAASGVEAALRSLSTNTKWHDSIVRQANESVEHLSNHTSHPSLLSLFSLMFLAGFPDIYYPGTLAILRDIGGDVKNVVIINNPPGEQTLVVNFKNRKRMEVKESSIEPVQTLASVFENSRIALLVGIIMKILSEHRGKGVGSNSSVEHMWVLGLVCKAFLNILKSGVDGDAMLEIIRSGVVPFVVNLACQGTGFSKQWMLRDLEVLSWKLYKTGEEGGIRSDHENGRRNSVSSSSSDEDKLSKSDSKSPLDGLDEETRLCMETIHEALHCPYPILRAIYERNGEDRHKLLEEVQRSFDGSDVRHSNEIRELAKQWEEDVPVSTSDGPNAEGTTVDSVHSVDSSIDNGILKFQSLPVEFERLEAKPERGDNPHKLISSLTEEEINETMARHLRLKSAELLKSESEAVHNNLRDYTRKVNFAVAVGYARQLVGWLFSCWPKSEEVILSLLDNLDPHNIVGLLDLIQVTESKQHFKKVVHNFIRCCGKQLIQPLALSAVQCMGEVHLASVVRESDHKYKNNANQEDKVTIPGACSLFIRFDERCSTEYNCDELVMASSPDMQQNKRVFSGSREWTDFELPGDSLYYKFTSDSSNTDWGWKFTVTGGQLGRFETGCSVLTALLAQDMNFARRLPLKQLWLRLIVVTCHQVGQQRLMALGLILRILQISAGDPYLFGEDVEPTPEKSRPNLSLLRPLWTLYTNSIAADTGASLALMSPVVRALSELFLVVENISQDWGEADDLVAGLASDDKLKKCFTKVVQKIAAIGMAIDLPNKAVEMVRNAQEVLPQSSDSTNDTGSGKTSQEFEKTFEIRISDLVSEEDSDDDDDDDDMMFNDDDTTQDEDDDDDDEDDDDDDDDDENMNNILRTDSDSDDGNAANVAGGNLFL